MNQSSVNQDQILNNLSNQSSWVRLLYMLIYGVMLHLAGMAMWILCTVQFLCTLIFGKDNDSLRRLSASLIDFIQRALQFVSYNSDDKPFPFAEDGREAQATDTAQAGREAGPDQPLAGEVLERQRDADQDAAQDAEPNTDKKPE